MKMKHEKHFQWPIFNIHMEVMVQPTRTIKNCDFFPGVKVSKEQRECLSVKVCEFASEELDIGHTSVDFSVPLFKNMFDANEEFHKKSTLWLVIFL